MKYSVRCQWTMQGDYHIKANSAEEAEAKVKDGLKIAPVLPFDNWLASPLEILSVLEENNRRI